MVGFVWSANLKDIEGEKSVGPTRMNLIVSDGFESQNMVGGIRRCQTT